MKRTIFIFVILALLTACGTKENQTATFSGDTSVIEHTYGDIGLALSAKVTVDQDIKVEATLKNVSGKTIVYNGRCGVPFHIFMRMQNSHAYLSHDQELIECEDIFDPNDLENFKAGDTFEKTVVFKREFALSNNKKTPAHTGDYAIEFSFTTNGDGHFFTEAPVYLKHDSEPHILTQEQAKQKTLTDSKVKKWHDQWKEKGIEIKTEKSLLSDGSWHICYHAIDHKMVNRIIVAVDYNTGEVKRVHTEEFEFEEGMQEWLDEL
ncbi:hypothetical protein ACLIA0_12810 [Bacillaceae bacterium W0354]